jgi:type III pantothenate kinase
MDSFVVADLSNSFTKLALATTTLLKGETRKLPTTEVNPESLTETSSDWSFDRVFLVSVVPEKTTAFETSFGDRLTIIDHTSDLGIGVEFPERSRIGGDRLANSVALAELYGFPGVVVDFGTAVTFDIVDGDRNYVGGVIAPGLSAMTDYLHERTALLPKIELQPPQSVIGKSTEEAMLSGAFHGYYGLVQNILGRVREAVASDTQPLRVIATGGYAALLHDGIPDIEEVNPNLTLEGVRIVAARAIRCS